MSTIRVNQLINVAGTGSPTFPFGIPGDFLPLRLLASTPADSILTILPSEIQDDALAGRAAPPNSGVVDLTLAAAVTVDFQTGAASPGVSFFPPSSTAGEFRRAAFSFNAPGGLISVSFSAPSATFPGTLPNPGTLFTAGTQPLGWVDLESTGGTAYKTAGSATSIIETNVGGSFRIHNFMLGGSTALATSTIYGLVRSYVTNPATSISSVSGDTTAVEGIATVAVTTGSVDRTVNLPAAASSTGRTITIIKVDSGSGKIIVDANGSETINGSLTTEIFTQYAFVTVQSTGSAWLIVGG